MGPEVIASPQVFNLYQALLNLGLAGLLLAVVIVPMLKWVMSEATEQRREFVKYLNDHAAILSEIKQILSVILNRYSQKEERKDGSS